MSEKALGRVVSKETRNKMSEAAKGRKLSETTIAKIRSYKHTEEAKIKIKLASVRARPVKVTNIISNEATVYKTMTEATVQLKTTTATIGSHFRAGQAGRQAKKPYLKRYLITTP
jgi:hypothetical protein